jgi:hypothetical protein
VGYDQAREDRIMRKMLAVKRKQAAEKQGKSAAQK